MRHRRRWRACARGGGVAGLRVLLPRGRAHRALPGARAGGRGLSHVARAAGVGGSPALLQWGMGPGLSPRQRSRGPLHLGERTSWAVLSRHHSPGLRRWGPHLPRDGTAGVVHPHDPTDSRRAPAHGPFCLDAGRGRDGLARESHGRPDRRARRCRRGCAAHPHPSPGRAGHGGNRDGAGRHPPAPRCGARAPVPRGRGPGCSGRGARMAVVRACGTRAAGNPVARLRCGRRREPARRARPPGPVACRERGGQRPGPRGFPGPDADQHAGRGARLAAADGLARPARRRVEYAGESRRLACRGCTRRGSRAARGPCGCATRRAS